MIEMGRCATLVLSLQCLALLMCVCQALRELKECKYKSAEVMFGIEESLDYSKEDFEKIICRMKELISVFDIGEGEGQVRFGLYPTWEVPSNYFKHKYSLHIPLNMSFSKIQLKRHFHQRIQVHKPDVEMFYSMEGALKEFKQHGRNGAEQLFVYFGTGRSDNIDKKFGRSFTQLWKDGGKIFAVKVKGTKQTDVMDFRLSIITYMKDYNEIDLEDKKITGMLERELLTNCAVCKEPAIDFVFLIDHYPLSSRAQFDTVINMIVKTLERFDVGSERYQVRAAVVSYTNVVISKQTFGLGDYTTKETLAQALKDLTWTRGSVQTQTHSTAMKYAMDTTLSQARSYAAKIMVILTDRLWEQPGNTPTATKDMTKQAWKKGIQTFIVPLGKTQAVKDFHDVFGNPWRVLYSPDVYKDKVRSQSVVNFLVDRTCLASLAPMRR